MSLDTTDTKGHDLAIPGDVRIYHFASAQHGGFSPVAPIPTSTGICQYLPNVNPYVYQQRALLVAMQTMGGEGHEAARQPLCEDLGRNLAAAE